jgi:CheY-like chemotaxis protein
VATNVLVIDDDALVRKVLARLLKLRFRASVREAADGQAGLKAVANEVPDLILLDVSMPVLDGLAFLTQLRQDHRLKAVPVITISAAGERETVTRMIELGVLDYLRKPLNVGAVEKRLARAFETAGLS